MSPSLWRSPFLLCITLQLATCALYSPSDQVNILTETNGTQFIVSQHSDGAKLHFLHFYADWCPHCRRFSAIFKTCLGEASRWQEMIDFSVIRCAERPSRWSPLCRAYKVMRIPQFRLFWFHPQASDLGIPVIPDIYNATKTCASVIETISKQWHRGVIPDHFRPFHPLLTPEEASTAVSNAGLAKKNVFVVVEGGKSLLGRQLVLRYGRSEKLIIYRIVLQRGNIKDTHKWKSFLGNAPNFELPFLLAFRLHSPTPMVIFSNQKNASESDLDYYSRIINA